MKQNNILILVVLVIAFFGGLFYLNSKSLDLSDTNNDIATTTGGAIDDSLINIGGVEFETDDGSETVISSGDLPPIPDLDRAIVIKEGLLLPKVEAATRERVQELTKILKENPGYSDGWLELGSLRKLIEDYDGVVDAWGYHAKIRPQNTISFLNLGDLYGYYIHDNEKAEKNFLIAVDNNSENILFPYIQTYDFYLYVLEDKTKAKNILIRAVKEIPSSKNQLQPIIDTL
tara:strand:+ start:5415 stop:6107 length:693 start_codon:yes stop_codon:yes gene_type:complete